MKVFSRIKDTAVSFCGHIADLAKVWKAIPDANISIKYNKKPIYWEGVLLDKWFIRMYNFLTHSNIIENGNKNWLTDITKYISESGSMIERYNEASFMIKPPPTPTDEDQKYRAITIEEYEYILQRNPEVIKTAIGKWVSHMESILPGHEIEKITYIESIGRDSWEMTEYGVFRNEQTLLSMSMYPLRKPEASMWLTEGHIEDLRIHAPELLGQYLYAPAQIRVDRNKFL